MPDQRQLLEAHVLAQIKTLEADRARVDAERARIDADLARYRSSLAELTRIGQTAVQALDLEPEKPEVEAPKGGLLIDAVAKYLEDIGSDMKSIRQIWAALEKAGFKVTSGHPTRAVKDALRKRSQRYGDVFTAGNRWGATKNFSDSQVKRLTKKFAGTGGKSAEEHGASTSAGIEQRRARGERVGAPPKMTAEKLSQVENLLRAGYSVTAISREVKISAPSIYNYFKHEDRVRLRAEGAAERDHAGDSQDDRPHGLRLVT